MQEDFHYYATYCAAFLAGYTHEESMKICYSAQFVDCCTETLLKKLNAPKAAATTQSQMELMNTGVDIISLQNITRIWSSFHFLPKDLYAPLKRRPLVYKNKYRLICGPNGTLATATVNLAKNRSLEAIGVAMHILADTWAHSYFAGTPAHVINNTNYYFFEIINENGIEKEKRVRFVHNPSAPDDVINGIYSNSLHQEKENSIMNLGHGRAGHFPDYSFAKYKYLPAWGNYNEIIKDNPSDYYCAFSQMVYALKYLKGEIESFETETYAIEFLKPWETEIREIIEKRQINANEDWKAFGERLSGESIDSFDVEKYQEEYLAATADEKDNTYLGKFFLAAMAQKSMVTNQIFKSGNMLAGFSVEYAMSGFKGIRDFKKLIEQSRGN